MTTLPVLRAPCLALVFAGLLASGCASACAPGHYINPVTAGIGAADGHPVSLAIAAGAVAAMGVTRLACWASRPSAGPPVSSVAPTPADPTDPEIGGPR